MQKLSRSFVSSNLCRFAPALVAVATMGGAQSALGSVIASEDFELPGASAFKIVFDSSDPDTVTSTSGIASGIGNPDNAMFVNVDASAGIIPDGGGNSYYGMQIGTNMVLDAPLTSTDITDYRTAIDASVLGNAEPTVEADLRLLFQNDDNTQLIRVTTSRFEIGQSYQTFSIDMTEVESGSPFDFATANLADVTNVTVLLRTKSALNDFGVDSGNELRGDNVTLTLIPEPASLMLIGSGLLVIAARRRRA